MIRFTVPVPLGGAGYEVVIGNDLLRDLGRLVANSCPANRYAVIADETVAEHWSAPVLKGLNALARADLVTFPAGERNKNREHWARLTDRLLHLELDRDGAIVALGGGVTGDLAGFVAATYLRGVACIQVPTSVLAMIDSSVGGKTGVDTVRGKNLVGAFHQPRLVVADVDTVSTLPLAHLHAGLAEAIKHAAIADPGYLQDLLNARDSLNSRDAATLAEVVHRSVVIKAAVVAADEREAGRRAVLNFGHTVAHAIETVMRYEVMHGEAVASGLVIEAELGRRLGVTREETAQAIRAAVEAFDLPVKPATGRVDDLVDAMRQDKKRKNGTVRFALIEALGVPYQRKPEIWTTEVPETLVREVLKGP